MAGEVQPSGQGPGTYKLLAHTQEEEDAFDFVKFRYNVKPTGVLASVAHIVKGALGAGILSGHVAYSKAGVLVAVPLTFIIGFYMYYCLYLLICAAQIMYKRTRVTKLTYSDIGEAAMACVQNPKVAKYSNNFRILIDTIITIDLFGSCACYQLIIAKTVKQLVENEIVTTIEGKAGYPGLRVYLAAFIIPIILICLITHLKYLAPFSLVANSIIVLAIVMAIYYAFVENPEFKGHVLATSVWSTLQYIGMSTFSMSCCGVVVALENNMKEPQKYPFALSVGMALVVMCVFLVSFFGYTAFLDKSASPIIVNFPLTTLPKILKGGIAAMIYVTHALNFWVPFNIVFYYIKKRLNPEKHFMWEMFYRAVFVTVISIVAITFPNINNIMGFLGTFCLSNMAFIFPNIIYLLVIWNRPGFGKYNWKMWRHLTLMGIGVFIFICGSIVNGTELILGLLRSLNIIKGDA